jgi:hypothetical protein
MDPTSLAVRSRTRVPTGGDLAQALNHVAADSSHVYLVGDAVAGVSGNGKLIGRPVPVSGLANAAIHGTGLVGLTAERPALVLLDPDGRILARTIFADAGADLAVSGQEAWFLGDAGQGNGIVHVHVAAGAQGGARGAIPWLPTRPPVAVEPQLAPRCRATDLRARLQLQGVFGNLVGVAVVRNAGDAPCSLRGRPSARFDGGPAEATALRIVTVPADRLDESLIYDRASSLRALGPGRVAAVLVNWGNWCPPGAVVTSLGTPPSALVLVLPGGGEIAAPVDRAPRCDEPMAPSTVAIKPFARRGRQPPPSSHLPLTAEIVGVATATKARPLRARRGGVLRYEVAVTNASRRPFRFRGCPTYLEDLAPHQHERYVLNCRPASVLARHETVRFAMVLRVAKNTPLGRHGLLWLLGPKTDFPPTASAPVVITK